MTGTPITQPSLIAPLLPSPSTEGTTSASPSGSMSTLSRRPGKSSSPATPSACASSRIGPNSGPSPTIRTRHGGRARPRSSAIARTSTPYPFCGVNAPML